MNHLPLLAAAVLLAGCATQAVPSGRLSSYDGLEAGRNGLRTGEARRADAPGLAAVRRVAIEPAVLADGPGVAWLSSQERALLLREVDAQVCFEVTERFPLVEPAAAPQPGDARLRVIVTGARPTGRAASGLSAAANFLIPGPIGLRVPGTVGGLTGEAELLSPEGTQLAAMVWNRNATPVGTDTPSFSRLGDALQFAEPFGDAVGAAVAPRGMRARKPDPDPCAAYGPRNRPAGWLAKFVTGVYTPSLSTSRPN